MRIIGEHRDTVLGVSCAPDGKHIISASMDDHVAIWDGKKRVGAFGVPSGCVCWMGAMSSTGVVAAGFGDLTVQVWSKKKQRQLAKLGGIVASLDWSADGKRLLTGNCGDKTVRLWEGDEEVARGKTKKSGAWFVALSPDGKTALSGAGDKLVHVWEIEAGREVGALSGHTGKILGLCFSKDGARAASASQDKTARIWDVKKGKPVATLAGHDKQVVGVALSRDGAQAATVSGDKTLRTWDAATGEELSCTALEDPPASVAWGKQIVVAAGKRILAF